jgi:hypothetical protein
VECFFFWCSRYACTGIYVNVYVYVYIYIYIYVYMYMYIYLYILFAALNSLYSYWFGLCPSVTGSFSTVSVSVSCIYMCE